MSAESMKKTTTSKTTKEAALKHLEAEATGSNTISVEFRGETLEIDREGLDDYEVVDFLSKGIPSLAFEVMVPDGEQRKRLMDTCEKSPRGSAKLSAVTEMVSELMAVIGAGK